MELKQSLGLTYLFISHDLSVVRHISDRIAVMFDGKIVQIATPQELYSRPISKKVASFIGVMNFLEGHLFFDEKLESFVDAGILGKMKVKKDQITIPIEPGPVIIGIRPEMMSLLFDDRDRTEFEISGIIKDSAYFGDMTYYTVEVSGRKSYLTISMRNTSGRRVLKNGESARIGWGSESFVILEKAEL